MSDAARGAVYLAIAAFAAAKGGGPDDADMMERWLWKEIASLPSRPAQAYEQLEEAWAQTRPA